MVIAFNPPDFFEPKAVCLRLGVAGQVEFFDGLAGKRPPAAFRQQGHCRPDIRTRLKSRTRIAVFDHAEIARCDAGDGTLVIIPKASPRKFRQNFGAKGFGLVPQPSA